MGLLTEAMLRRIGKHCGLGSRTRVLTIGFDGGAAPAFLAREFAAKVVAADADDDAVTRQRNALRAHGAEDRVSARRVDYERLPVVEHEFEAIVLEALAMRLDVAARALRRHLALDGRLCLTHPVRVGRFPNPAMIRLWEQKIGEPLRLPSECLQAMEREGYEPQTAEVLDDSALEAYYRQLEHAHGANGEPGPSPEIQEEVALFRSQGGRAGASFAMLVARRREPGEKPPVAHNE
ncbi:MAG TPA: methyltransferase domain-containing protein [Myxococcaceae bacterium]|nr:methyltransferase domain-containing protein [Myxococcaceae bacterium]